MPKEIPIESYFPSIKYFDQAGLTESETISRRALIGGAAAFGLFAREKADKFASMLTNKRKIPPQFQSFLYGGPGELIGDTLVTGVFLMALGLGGFAWDNRGRLGFSSKETTISAINSLVKTRFGGAEKITEQNLAQITEILSRLTMLPPCGAKVALYGENEISANHYDAIFSPSFTAEETARKIIAFRHAKPSDVYLSQFSVQGKLRDDFKLAAMSLILASPVANDWSDPAITLPWGMMGPLIHDGGNTVDTLNPQWRKYQGRTDFIHRVYIQDRKETSFKGDYKLNQLFLGNIEELTPEDRRIYEDCRFYQRAGFINHCAHGQHAEHTPTEIVQAGAGIWKEYSRAFGRLVHDFKLDFLLKTPWIRDTGKMSFQGHYGARFEADGQPIIDDLNRMEEVKLKHPEIISKAASLNKQLVDLVDYSLAVRPITN